MKRLLLRLSALSLVVMLGWIAIARAQRGEPIDSPPPQSANDPFANSSALAAQTATDTAPTANSSVRMVSVQDFPAQQNSAPPRSVPNEQSPGNSSALTIHDTAATTAGPTPTGQTDGNGALASNNAPPTEMAAAAPVAPFSNPVPAGNAALVSATEAVRPSSPAPPAADAGHSIFLGRGPAAAPVEVAQAPAAFEPPPSASPIAESQAADQAPPPPMFGVPAPSSATGPADPNGPAVASAVGPTISQTAAQSPPAAIPDGGPTLTPIVDPSPNSQGISTASLRPIGPGSTAADLTAPPADPAHPDPRHVEGSQSPQLTIEKIAPTEVQVGKQARFELRVRNIGSAPAQGVEVHDAVPQGMQFVSSNPPTTQGPNGQLAWSLGELKPGEQAAVQLELMPTAEGDIRSQATVTFRTEVSVHTLATKPRLVLQLSAPKQVLIGEEATMTISISNPGTGAATGIVLSERVPHGLRHKAGNDLEFDVGTLRPGQSRQIELAMSAVEAGHVINSLQARADARLHAQARAEFDVVAPALAVAMTGPTRRYLERQATYTVAVSNPGTAPARDIELVTELPRGMKFVKANNAGHYDPQTRTVTWNLEELPPSETGSVTLVAVPIEAGEQRLKIAGKARQGLSDAKEKTVIVEGLAAVTFDVRGEDEAIEVGGETTYQIHVVNEGSMAATNMIVSALFPAEMKPVRAEGPAKYALDRHAVQFEPIPRLEPKGEATFRIRAQAIQPGDLRVKVQVQTDDMRQPVLKEENTRVYVDR